MISIENDLAEVLLGLFIPWSQLPILFQQYAPLHETKRDACAHIWNAVKSTLPQHNWAFAENIVLLRKSKRDCEVDAAL